MAARHPSDVEVDLNLPDAPEYGAPTPYPNNETEDWIKGNTWPYVDEDGDDMVCVAELLAYYPDIDPVALLTLPVGKAMPAHLRTEMEVIAAAQRERARRAAAD